MKTNTQSVVLPRVMSELLEIALEDLRKCEADPVYKIDMGSWHSPNPEKTKCSVCMAGAVMAGHLGLAPSAYATPSRFGKNADQLDAIDDIRCGAFLAAARMLNVDVDPSKVDPLYEKYGNYDGPDYGEPGFWPWYDSMLSDLKAAGL